LSNEGIKTAAVALAFWPWRSFCENMFGNLMRAKGFGDGFWGSGFTFEELLELLLSTVAASS